jgi:hypothetical protein
MSQQYPNQAPNPQYGVYPQPPQGQPPAGHPPAQGQFPQPPKKNHTGRTALIVIGAVFALIMVISIAANGGKSPKADQQGTPAGVVAAPAVKTSAPASKPAASAKPSVQPSAQAKPTAPAKPAGPACADQDDRNEPCVVLVGRAFQLGEHTVLAGWKIQDSGFGMTIVGKARNTGDKSSTMFINVKFLRGDEVMANVMCNTSELAPGQSEAMNCIADGTYTKKFDKVTAEAAF